MKNCLKKPLIWAILGAFLLNTGVTPRGYAVALLGLPEPGKRVFLSAKYDPAIIEGMKVNKVKPFNFDFILDPGQDRLEGIALKKEGEKLIKYFMAGLAIPEQEVWVNLSPYEKGHIAPQILSQTPLGRDLLAQDYLLKQITVSLIYPQEGLGKKFWNAVFARMDAQYGHAVQVPVNTFNKVWIKAENAEIFEDNQTAFVVKSHLKVMLEEDYLSLSKHHVLLRGAEGDAAIFNRPSNNTHTIGAKVIRQIILPELEKEVNAGRNFANLRQIFNSLILAAWYKKTLKESILNQVYANKAKVRGIRLDDPTVKEKIYQRYLQAYKKGVFNFIKEEPLNVSLRGGEADEAIAQAGPGIFKRTTIARKYFAGGMDGHISFTTNHNTQDLAAIVPENRSMMDINVDLQNSPRDAAMLPRDDSNLPFADDIRVTTIQRVPMTVADVRRGDWVPVRAYYSRDISALPYKFPDGGHLRDDSIGRGSKPHYLYVFRKVNEVDNPDADEIFMGRDDIKKIFISVRDKYRPVQEEIARLYKEKREEIGKYTDYVQHMKKLTKLFPLEMGEEAVDLYAGLVKELYGESGQENAGVGIGDSTYEKIVDLYAEFSRRWQNALQPSLGFSMEDFFEAWDSFNSLKGRQFVNQVIGKKYISKNTASIFNGRQAGFVRDFVGELNGFAANLPTVPADKRIMVGKIKGLIKIFEKIKKADRLFNQGQPIVPQQNRNSGSYAEVEIAKYLNATLPPDGQTQRLFILDAHRGNLKNELGEAAKRFEITDIERFSYLHFDDLPVDEPSQADRIVATSLSNLSPKQRAWAMIFIMRHIKPYNPDAKLAPQFILALPEGGSLEYTAWERLLYALGFERIAGGDDLKYTILEDSRDTVRTKILQQIPAEYKANRNNIVEQHLRHQLRTIERPFSLAVYARVKPPEEKYRDDNAIPPIDIERKARGASPSRGVERLPAGEVDWDKMSILMARYEEDIDVGLAQGESTETIKRTDPRARDFEKSLSALNMLMRYTNTPGETRDLTHVMVRRWWDENADYVNLKTWKRVVKLAQATLLTKDQVRAMFPLRNPRGIPRPDGLFSIDDIIAPLIHQALIRLPIGPVSVLDVFKMRQRILADMAMNADVRKDVNARFAAAIKRMMEQGKIPSFQSALSIYPDNNRGAFLDYLRMLYGPDLNDEQTTAAFDGHVRTIVKDTMQSKAVDVVDELENDKLVPTSGRIARKLYDSFPYFKTIHDQAREIKPEQFTSETLKEWSSSYGDDQIENLLPSTISKEEFDADPQFQAMKTGFLWLSTVASGTAVQYKGSNIVLEENLFNGEVYDTDMIGFIEDDYREFPLHVNRTQILGKFPEVDDADSFKVDVLNAGQTMELLISMTVPYNREVLETLKKAGDANSETYTIAQLYWANNKTLQDLQESAELPESEKYKKYYVLAERLLRRAIELMMYNGNVPSVEKLKSIGSNPGTRDLIEARVRAIITNLNPEGQRVHVSLEDFIKKAEIDIAKMQIRQTVARVIGNAMRPDITTVGHYFYISSTYFQKWIASIHPNTQDYGAFLDDWLNLHSVDGKELGIIYPAPNVTVSPATLPPVFGQAAQKETPKEPVAWAIEEANIKKSIETVKKDGTGLTPAKENIGIALFNNNESDFNAYAQQHFYAEMAKIKDPQQYAWILQHDRQQITGRLRRNIEIRRRVAIGELMLAWIKEKVMQETGEEISNEEISKRYRIYIPRFTREKWEQENAGKLIAPKDLKGGSGNIPEGWLVEMQLSSVVAFLDEYNDEQISGSMEDQGDDIAIRMRGVEEMRLDVEEMRYLWDTLGVSGFTLGQYKRLNRYSAEIKYNINSVMCTIMLHVNTSLINAFLSSLDGSDKTALDRFNNIVPIYRLRPVNHRTIAYLSLLLMFRTEIRNMRQFRPENPSLKALQTLPFAKEMITFDEAVQFFDFLKFKINVPYILSKLFEAGIDPKFYGINQAMVSAPGGIDLNTADMSLKVRRRDNGVKMNIDQAALARTLREGVDDLKPFIRSMTPVASIWSLLDLTPVSG